MSRKVFKTITVIMILLSVGFFMYTYGVYSALNDLKAKRHSSLTKIKISEQEVQNVALRAFKFHTSFRIAFSTMTWGKEAKEEKIQRVMFYKEYLEEKDLIILHLNIPESGPPWGVYSMVVDSQLEYPKKGKTSKKEIIKTYTSPGYSSQTHYVHVKNFINSVIGIYAALFADSDKDVRKFRDFIDRKIAEHVFQIYGEESMNHQIKTVNDVFIGNIRIIVRWGFLFIVFLVLNLRPKYLSESSWDKFSVYHILLFMILHFLATHIYQYYEDDFNKNYSQAAFDNHAIEIYKKHFFKHTKSSMTFIKDPKAYPGMNLDDPNDENEIHVYWCFQDLMFHTQTRGYYKNKSEDKLTHGSGFDFDGFFGHEPLPHNNVLSPQIASFGNVMIGEIRIYKDLMSGKTDSYIEECERIREEVRQELKNTIHEKFSKGFTRKAQLEACNNWFWYYTFIYIAYFYLLVIFHQCYVPYKEFMVIKENERRLEEEKIKRIERMKAQRIQEEKEQEEKAQRELEEKKEREELALEKARELGFSKHGTAQKIQNNSLLTDDDLRSFENFLHDVEISRNEQSQAADELPELMSEAETLFDELLPIDQNTFISKLTQYRNDFNHEDNPRKLKKNLQWIIKKMSELK